MKMKILFRIIKNNQYLCGKLTSMKAIFNFLFLCFFAWIQAHSVWIETDTNAKINQPHEIKVFFGELDSPTPTAKWFSDIKDLEIKVVSPSGREFLLKEKTEKEQFYLANFVPTENGVYKISVHHLVRNTHRKMKITYQSIAFINTDNQREIQRLGNPPLELALMNNLPKINESFALKTFLEGEAKAKEKIKILADNGWELSLRTDEKGEASFKPLWKGKYLVEYANDKKVLGMHNGQEYNSDYQVITMLINV